MKKKSVLAILCITLMLGACASKKADPSETKTVTTKTDEKTADQTERETYQANLNMITPAAYGNVDGLNPEPGSYISVIGKAGDTAFWRSVAKGVQAARDELNEKLGYKGKDKIKVTYNAPSEADNVDEQVNILDEELARYPIALAISIADTKACEVQFDLATENNIPIVAFDSGSDYKGIQAMAATENEKAARQAADRMAELVGEEGKVVLLIHDSKSETAKLRETPFLKRMKKKHPKIDVSGTYRLDEMKETVANEVNAGTCSLSDELPSGQELAEEEKIDPQAVTEEQIMDYIMKKNPDAKGIYGTTAEVIDALLKAMERNHMKDVPVIGYDIDELSQKALEEGKIRALVVQNPFGMGYASVVSAARAALGIGNEAQINTGYLWVTKENLSDAAVQNILQ